MGFARHRQTVPILEQWLRVNRWYGRLLSFYHQADQRRLTSDDFVDYFIAAYQNLFACRDWLVQTYPNLRSDIQLLFASPELKLCRDIAIGTKHLRITTPSVDADFAIVQEHVPTSGVNTTSGSVVFRLLCKGKQYDLRDLLNEGILQVNKFLYERNIITARNEVQPFSL